MDGQGVLPGWIVPIVPGRRVAGWVCTASIAESDSLGLRQAIARGPIEGTVLVALGSPSGDRAIIGDIVAAWMLSRGFEALVTDALVRDSAQLRKMSLAFWCRGVTPVASTHAGPGSVAIPLTCGSVTVAPGDLLVADDDGVIVTSANRVPELLASAEKRLHRDEERADQVRRGLAPG
jgi:regulator of RNase E activity RraA